MFQSVFKINNIPILPPVITNELREEIIQIRLQVKQKLINKQQKLKTLKNYKVQDEIRQNKLVRSNSFNVDEPSFCEDEFKLKGCSIEQSNRTSTPFNEPPTQLFTTDSESNSEYYYTCCYDQNISVTNNNLMNKSQAILIIQAYTRGYLTRKLMKTEYVQECIKVTKDGLHSILNSPFIINDTSTEVIILKSRILKQLQHNLGKINAIFNGFTPKYRMDIIRLSREHAKKEKRIYLQPKITDLSLVCL
ncbi:unnamed protein product [Diamesa tonsa]